MSRIGNLLRMSLGLAIALLPTTAITGPAVLKNQKADPTTQAKNVCETALASVLEEYWESSKSVGDLMTKAGFMGPITVAELKKWDIDYDSKLPKLNLKGTTITIDGIIAEFSNCKNRSFSINSKTVEFKAGDTFSENMTKVMAALGPANGKKVSLVSLLLPEAHATPLLATLGAGFTAIGSTAMAIVQAPATLAAGAIAAGSAALGTAVVGGRNMYKRSQCESYLKNTAQKLANSRKAVKMRDRKLDEHSPMSVVDAECPEGLQGRMTNGIKKALGGGITPNVKFKTQAGTTKVFFDGNRFWFDGKPDEVYHFSKDGKLDKITNAEGTLKIGRSEESNPLFKEYERTGLLYYPTINQIYSDGTCQYCRGGLKDFVNESTVQKMEEGFDPTPSSDPANK